MTTMTDKMAQAGSGRPVMKEAGVGTPKAGECFRCQTCGMEVEVTADCRCKDADHVHFQCCGKEMQRT